MEVIAIAGLVISAVTLLCLIGGGFYWWGRLSIRVDRLEQRTDELNDKIDGVRDELNAKIDGVRDELSAKIDGVRDELSAKIDGVRDELSAKMDSMRSEILTEMRRSEERILTALAYHSHIAPEAGRAVFWQPIGSTTPAYPPGEGTPAAGQPEAEAPAA